MVVDEDDSGPPSSSTTRTRQLTKAAALASTKPKTSKQQQDSNQEPSDNDDDQDNTSNAVETKQAPPPSGRSRRTTKANLTGQVLKQIVAGIVSRIEAIQARAGRLQNYTLTTSTPAPKPQAKPKPKASSTTDQQSATSVVSNQSAKTTTRWTDENGALQEESYVTTGGKHSEMVALEDMLDNGLWILRADGLVTTADGSEVAKANFKTPLPHCAFCTVMLTVLGLPRTIPTKGSHLKGANAEYPLPRDVEGSEAVLRAILDPPETDHNDDDEDDIKRSPMSLDSLLEKIYPVFQPSSEASSRFELAVKDGRLKDIWTWIFQAIYETSERVVE